MSYLDDLKNDYAFYETENILEDIIAEIESVYGQCYEELLAKAEAYTRHFESEDAKKRHLVETGQLDIKDYKIWLRTALLTGRLAYEMLDVVSHTLTSTNRVADSIINGYMPQVYATNLNYATYRIQHDLGVGYNFSIYDERTVERLIREHPELLPKPNRDIPKDQQWNKAQINSAVIQSVMQGEPMSVLANRIASVSDMNLSSAKRNAATISTSVQNGGRLDGFRQATANGIKGIKKRWVATLDGHTRASHRALDGEVVGIEEEFSNGLMFPADPNGHPKEVYNCRCVMIAAYPDSEFDISMRDNRLKGMSYEQWKTSNGGEPLFRAARNVNRDMRMYEEYSKLLGGQLPRNFREFQDIKYGNHEKWQEMVKAAREERNKRRK